MTQTPHGVPPRGLTEVPRQRSYDGRFGRLFQQLANEPAHDPTHSTDLEELRVIAAAMVEAAGQGSDNPRIPAGYVYLGQFIDHDITFDPTSQLQRRNDPEGLINFRTPRFDLDSVYGSGPFDEPFQYNPDEPHSGFRLLIDTERGPDLPRNTRGRALIGDPRNDENGIISQLHVAFLSLHNRLLDDHTHIVDPRERFEAAQRQAQWHYQWVVVHDFLPRTIGDDLFNALVFTASDGEGGMREMVRLRHYRHKVNPYLPVEFSAGAYRFGHSQVQDSYSINGQFNRRLFSPDGDDFRGFQPLRAGWHTSWPFFFELDETGPQLSRSIDASLAETLTTLQGGTGDSANLPLLNLARGAALGLPSGQSLAAAMNVVPLSDDELSPAAPGRAPLWFYILREAQVRHDGAHLGEVGGRIVAETLLGLLRVDPQSYLTINPTWLPELPTRSGDPRNFDMADLLSYAVPSQSVRF